MWVDKTDARKSSWLHREIDKPLQVGECYYGNHGL